MISKKNLIPLVISLIPCTLFIAFLPMNKGLYYAMLAYLTVYSIIKMEKFNTMPCFFLVACAMSIAMGNPPAFFQPWMRLGLFALLLFAIFPIIDGEAIRDLRSKIFRYTMWCCAIVGVSGLPCYVLGINFMTRYYGLMVDGSQAGIFSGITIHSMILGPVSSCGAIFLLYKATGSHIKKARNMYWIGTVLCVCSVILSASRIAVAATLVGGMVLCYYRFRAQFSRFVGKMIIAVIVLFATYPLYEGIAAPLIAKQTNNEASGGTFSSREGRWEHRIEEFVGSPIFGYGFSSIDPKNHGEYSARLGIVESGSSWLSMFSMTGMLGAIPVVYMLVSTLRRLRRMTLYSHEEAPCADSEAVLLLGIMSFFAIHMIAEGYIFAGGSWLCYLFWMSLGTGYSLTRQ